MTADRTGSNNIAEQLENLASSIPKRHIEYFELFKQAILELNAPPPTAENDDEPAPPAFFYGTLMALPVLFKVIYNHPEPPKHVTDHLIVRPAILKGHRRRYVRHCDYPGVTVDETSEVAGTVVIGLTKGNMRVLHRFEGIQYTPTPVKVSVLMERTLVKADGPDGEPLYENEVWEDMGAMSYLYTAGNDRLRDEEWSFKTYMTTRMSTWAGLISPVSERSYDSRGYWKDAVVVTTTEPTTVTIISSTPPSTSA